MIKTLLVLVSVFVLGSSQASELPTPSIFEEGVDESISPEDIGEDVRQWAQNTSLKLQKLLERIKEPLPPAEKRALIIKTLQESVLEAQNHRELLLMRFCLNRALALDELYEAEDMLSVQQILLPAVKQAIRLYKEADLPFLDANKDKPQSEIEPPSYAAFTKNNIGYLLNSSNLNKSLLNQFLILKYSIVWVAKDLLRSPQTKRNPINSALILDFEKIFEEVKDITPAQVTYKLNNKMRKILLNAHNAIVTEEKRPEPPAPLPPQVELTSELLGDFAKIPAGTFMMGSPQNEPNRGDDESQHQVTLTENFEMMKTEVTQKIWFSIMRENPSHFKERKYCLNSWYANYETGQKIFICPNNPVENVSWKDVQRFVTRLNEITNDGYTYRLPTEAEWEYAERAGTETAFNLGEHISADQVNYIGKYPYKEGIYREKTVDVGSLLNANNWGLY